MSKNDDRIVALQKQVDDKREALAKAAKRFAPVTTCSIEFEGGRLNLNVLNREQIVLLACKLKAINDGASSLRFDSPMISGFSVTDWLTDCMSRLAVIDHKDETDKLAKMEAKLKGLLSADKKTELELDELEAML